MYQDELDSAEKLKTIWNKRMGWLIEENENNKSSSKVECGFDFSNGIHPHLQYNSDNFRDAALKDFRELLENVREGNTPDGFLADTTKNNGVIHTNSIESGTDLNEHIRIDVTTIEDQTYCLIYAAAQGVYSVSWYKQRGRIDSILNLEYGHPITLEEMTDLLIALGLEA